MASSGSVDFTVTRDDIINAAAFEIGVKALGQTLTSEVTDPIAQALNMLVKQWQGKADFAPGLKVWTRRRAYLFLQSDQHQYALGPTGDHATESFVSTTLTASVSATDTSLTVSSITGISSGDNIGIIQDDGSIHWDTVNGAPSGSTVVITNGMASAASANNTLYAYTTKMRRPVDLLTISLRNSDTEDTPIEKIDLYQYEAISAKTADGTPTQAYYEAQRGNGQLYLSSEPTNMTNYVRMVYLSDIEDFDTGSDNPDYPVEWFRALKYNLAVDIAPGFGKQVTNTLAALAVDSLSIARNANPETSAEYFQPGLD